MERKIHQGRNIKRFREMLGIKQEALAFDLGEEWNQKKISQLEQKETIEDPLLQKISGVLKIPVDAFKNFEEEHAVNIIANNFSLDNGSLFSARDMHGTSQVFTPVETILKIHEEKIALYERMLKEKDEILLKLETLRHPQ